MVIFNDRWFLDCIAPTFWPRKSFAASSPIARLGPIPPGLRGRLCGDGPHRTELMEDWNLCQAKQLPKNIAPLE